jgi:hypothetical protein
MNNILDMLEAKALLEAATPENPVKLRIEDGEGQHVDILVADATVDIKPSESEVVADKDEPIRIDMTAKYD